jgi:hypothetical protein
VTKVAQQDLKGNDLQKKINVWQEPKDSKSSGGMCKN